MEHTDSIISAKQRMRDAIAKRDFAMLAEVFDPEAPFPSLAFFDLRWMAETLASQLQSAADRNDMETVLKVLLIAEKTGIPSIETLLESDECAAFRWAAGNGCQEVVKALVTRAGKADCLPLFEKVLTENECDMFHLIAENGHTEVNAYLAAQPNAPLSIRKLFQESYASLAPKDAVFPSPDDLGEVGKPYPFAQALGVSLKYAPLSMSPDGLDMKTQASLYRDAKQRPCWNGRSVNWGGLNEALDGVSDAQVGRIADTLREVTKYAAGYLLVADWRAKGKEDALAGLDSEALNRVLAPYQQKLQQRMVEQFTLPQLAKLSDQWHHYRINKVKTSSNASTLRDRAEEGSWYCVLPEKEVAVSAPGLQGYSLVNLTTAGELMSEHLALGHCVDGYVDKCKQGYQVFSLRKHGVPQTTLGFTYHGGALTLDQHTGKGNRQPTSDERMAEKWFVKAIRDGTVPLNLQQVGEISADLMAPPIENLLGVALKDLTPARLQSNLDLLTCFGKEYGQWSQKAASKRDLYLFGAQNKGASLAEFAQWADEKQVVRLPD